MAGYTKSEIVNNAAYVVTIGGAPKAEAPAVYYGPALPLNLLFDRLAANR